MNLGELDAQAPANRSGGTAQRRKGDGGIAGVEQAVELPPARLHPSRHVGLGKAFCLHRRLDLIGDHLLEGSLFGLREDALGGEEFIEGLAPVDTAVHTLSPDLAEWRDLEAASGSR